MKINPKIVELAKSSNLNVADALLFCFAVNNQEFDMLDRLLERGILDENEYMFRINLCNIDEDGRLALRHSLYTTDDNIISYMAFNDMLIKNYSMTVNGHINNPRAFKVMDDAEETYNSLLLSIPDVDIQRLCKVVSEHYRKTEYCTGFKKFFSMGAKLEYDNFSDDTSSGLL